MTKQEILNKLIPYYEDCIKDIEEMDDVDDIHVYCDSKNIDAGICWCSFNEFNQFIQYKKWVRRNYDNDIFWTTTPMDCKTKPEIIQALQIRVDIMKRELEIID